MNSHLSGPCKDGQGAIMTQRGKVILFSDAAGTTELLTVEGQNLSVYPVLVEVIAIIETAFDGTGASITVQVTPEGGSAADLIAAGGLTESAAGNVTFRRLCFGRDKFTVVFAPGTSGTAGRVPVFARPAGVGIPTPVL